MDNLKNRIPRDGPSGLLVPRSQQIIVLRFRLSFVIQLADKVHRQAAEKDEIQSNHVYKDPFPGKRGVVRYSKDSLFV